MLSTLSISSPANLNFFFSFGLFENLIDGGTAGRKDNKISSAMLRTGREIRCNSFLDGLCLLVHFRLYYRTIVHFIVLNLIFSHVVFNYFWLTREQDVRGYEEPSAIDIKSNCKSRAVRDRYSLLTSKQKQKLRDEEKASTIKLQVVKINKFATVD